MMTTNLTSFPLDSSSLPIDFDFATALSHDQVPWNTDAHFSVQNPVEYSKTEYTCFVVGQWGRGPYVAVNYDLFHGTGSYRKLPSLLTITTPTS